MNELNEKTRQILAKKKKASNEEIKSYQHANELKRLYSDIEYKKNPWIEPIYLSADGIDPRVLTWIK